MSTGDPWIPLLFVIIAGIPHGAADGLVARRVGLARGWIRALAYYAGYLASVLLVLLAWQLAPVPGLAIFLIISWLHFGLGDASPTRRASLANQVLAHGGLVAVVIPVAHPDAVSGLFEILSGSGSHRVLDVLQWAGFPLWCLATLAYLVQDGLKPSSGPFEVLVLAGICLMLPPLWAFAIYFCLVHSVRHFRQLAMLFRASPEVKHGWLEIAILSVLAWLMIVAVALWLETPLTLDNAFVKATFVVVAALTVPHMILIDGLRAIATKTMPH